MTVPVPEVIIAVFVDNREGNHVAAAAAASVDNNNIIIIEKVRCVLQFVHSPKLFLGQTDIHTVPSNATYAKIHAEAQTCMASDDLSAAFTKSSPWQPVTSGRSNC